MQKHIIVNIPFYTEGNSSFPKPVLGNDDYWLQTVDYFLRKSDCFEIHCWNEEAITIEELKSTFYPDIEIQKEDNLTIFHGKKTAAFVHYLSNSYTNKARELKWFTVNLLMGERMVFHSSHWGTEIYVPHATEKEVAYIKSVCPKDAQIESY
ncbi:hypothetical protein ACTNDN_06280 [Niallia sp. HCP3S3_B10]|uniref:hypothetical protein n=1 Tax=Niallia sp. HCP3S3_B10 TaxID=3438944 RepID=UPI003F8CDDBC